MFRSQQFFKIARRVATLPWKAARNTSAVPWLNNADKTNEIRLKESSLREMVPQPPAAAAGEAVVDDSDRMAGYDAWVSHIQQLARRGSDVGRTLVSITKITSFSEFFSD